MVLARLRSAASRSRWATATKTASRMLSCTMRAAAFSPRSGDPWAVEHSTTSAMSAMRRAAVVGDGDRPRALTAGQLQGFEDGGRRAGMREADRDVLGPEQRGRHQHHVRVVEDAGADADAQELVGDVAGDLRRAADAVEVALAGVVDVGGSLIEGLRDRGSPGFPPAPASRCGRPSGRSRRRCRRATAPDAGPRSAGCCSRRARCGSP